MMNIPRPVYKTVKRTVQVPSGKVEYVSQEVEENVGGRIQKRTIQVPRPVYVTREIEEQVPY